MGWMDSGKTFFSFFFLQPDRSKIVFFLFVTFKNIFFLVEVTRSIPWKSPGPRLFLPRSSCVLWSEGRRCINRIGREYHCFLGGSFKFWKVLTAYAFPNTLFEILSLLWWVTRLQLSLARSIHSFMVTSIHKICPIVYEWTLGGRKLERNLSAVKGSQIYTLTEAALWPVGNYDTQTLLRQSPDGAHCTSPRSPLKAFSPLFSQRSQLAGAPAERHTSPWISQRESWHA